MFREIFKRCVADHVEEGADLDNTRIRGFTQRSAKLEYGQVTYRAGKRQHLWAEDYRTTKQDSDSGLPQALTKIDVLKPEGENNIILYAHGSAIDGIRSRLMAMPEVYREVAQSHGDRMHTYVFTMRPENITELILAMYCDPRLHTRS